MSPVGQGSEVTVGAPDDGCGVRREEGRVKEEEEGSVECGEKGKSGEGEEEGEKGEKEADGRVKGKKRAVEKSEVDKDFRKSKKRFRAPSSAVTVSGWG